MISDEVYERFTWDVPHVSIASLDADDRVFSVFSLSKTYAMTGIRVGWLVTPRGFHDTMLRVQESAISCVNTPAQYAADRGAHRIAAAGHGCRGALPRELRRRRRAARCARHPLSDADRGVLPVDRPGHATGGDVAAWTVRFLEEQGVAVAPGTAFGAGGEGWIRVCLASDRAELLAGLGRLPAP